jgi:hypothetical protein
MPKKNLFTADNQPEGRGRPKGSKNRTTEEMREFIQKVVDKNFERLEEDLDKMNPTNRWTIIQKITQYFMPILSKNDNNNNMTGDITINVKYIDEQPPTKEIL